MAFDPLSRERLLAYLLGELPPLELAALDERVLADEAFADLLEEARNDLLDAYVLGALSQADRERARRALNLAPGGGGSEADFSRALTEALRRDPEARPGSRPRVEESGWLRSQWTPLWATALAACLVAALGVWISRGPAFLGGEPGGARPNLPAGSEISMGGSSFAHPDEGFVLLLQSAVMRGQSPEQTVRLPQALQALQTQIIVPSATARYDVRVESPSGQFAYHELAPQSASGESFVQFSIPRERLSSGIYDFQLLQASSGSPRLVRRYSVHIIVP